MQETREEIKKEPTGPIFEIKRMPEEEEPIALEDFGLHSPAKKPRVMTRGFRQAFEDHSHLVSWLILDQLYRVVREKGRIDYHQEFEVAYADKTTKVWVIDDGAAVTLLLPEEY